MRTQRILIIGAGIVGTSIARELAKFENLEIYLIEKEADVGWGSTKANSALIHGCYTENRHKVPLRAKLCKMGNILWREIVKDLEIPSIWPGAYIVALDDDQVKTLEKMKATGEDNGIPGLKIIDGDELRKVEPNINPSAVAALYSPTVGIISPYEAAIALMENAIDNGVKLYLNSKVLDIKVSNNEFTVITSKKEFKVDFVINAAGLYGDEISKMVGINYFTIRPRKGEYFLFDKSLGKYTNHVLFPTPTPISKGILVTFTVDGHTMIGPNARDIDDKEDTSTTRDGLREVYEGAKKLVPNLPPIKYAITTFAGLRPEPSTEDFIIQDYKEVPGFINAVGTRSPGLTSAPAIAVEVRKILGRYINLIEKKKFKRFRKPIIRFSTLSNEEREELIKKDKRYGNIVCRCELVTEAEIVEAIRRGASTLDGIKFRVRAGMGRCQGGFCTPKIIKIMSRELNIKPTEITKKGNGSYLLVAETKT
ncbi:MAG: NAD(P)/FAD-dependent oxidoreductase [Candidatus Asgardarchaeia archaeon]